MPFTLDNVRLPPTRTGVTNHLRRVDHLERAESRHQDGVHSADHVQPPGPRADDFFRLFGIRLVTGDAPHDGALIRGVRVRVVIREMNVRAACDFGTGAFHAIRRLRCLRGTKLLVAAENRFLSRRHGGFHPFKITTTVKQPRMNQLSGGMTAVGASVSRTDHSDVELSVG